MVNNVSNNVFDYASFSELGDEGIFKCMLDSCEHIILLVDNHLNLKYCNPKAKEILNRHFDPTISFSQKKTISLQLLWPQLFDKLSQFHTYEDIKYLPIHETFKNYETHYNVAITPIESEAPKFSGILITIDETTQQYIQKQELKSREQLYRNLIDTIPHPIIHKDKDLKYVTVNTSYADLYGKAPDAFIGITDFDIHSEEDAIKYRQEDAQVIQSAKPIEFSRVYHNNNIKTDIFVNGIKTPVYDHMNNISGILAIFWNITERNRAERLFELIFSVSADLTCIAGFDGYLRKINPAWSEQLGYTIEELLAKPWLEHVVDEDLEITNKQTEKLVKGIPLLNFNNRYHTKTGDVIWLSWNAIPLINDNLIVATARNITQAKELELKLHDYANTQNILLREVNHRVKNNLTSIVSMITKEATRIHDQPHIAVFDDSINSLIGRVEALATVHSMLTATEWQPIQISALCHEIIATRLQAVHKPQIVNISTATSNVTISSERAHQLALVINEIATNMIKYGLGDRQSAVCEIDIWQKDATIHLAFKDDGPGYPESIINNEIDSHNIGLRMIQGIVERNLSGRVTLKNKNGACVFITFAKSEE